MDDESTTFEMFIKLRTLCDRVGAVLTTNYFGDSQKHIVKIIYSRQGSGKLVNFKQTGDSLNFCLKPIYYRAEERIEELISSGELIEKEINYNRLD